ncbi:MAG: beta strand repeat-containing protein [Candidatus Sulfotelmatobacter sp.]
MNRKIYLMILIALVCVAFGLLTSCSSSSSTKTPPVVLINAAASSTPQSATVGTAFANPLVANVTTGGTATQGATVTFAAPSSGASCTLSSTTATTDASGNASVTCTANTTVSASGTNYTVTATTTGATTPANFVLTNTAVPTANFVFYLSGAEAPNAGNSELLSYYAVAGVVTIDQNENVVGGEEDYNDGGGITQTDVAITGGALSVDATGQGTLTLNVPSATGLGNPAGTEILGIQAVNISHILIVQYDGSATSSGSMDLQTATSVADGGYAFTLTGVDTAYSAVAYGGVFSVTSGAATGIADVNDAGLTPAVATGQTITGAAFAGADANGRGSLTGVNIDGTALTLNYYVVGPEVIRIINVDVGSDTPGTGGAAIGSAFGQGTGTSFSLPAAAVFSLENTLYGNAYAAVGMLAPAAGSFTGTGDDDELGTPVMDSALLGTYTISNTVGGTVYNGYSSLAIGNGGLGTVTTLGLYNTDPALNLSDPNNTTGGGGALLLDLDAPLAGGTGILIPQTDVAAADFNGTYAYGGQDFNQGIPGWFGEIDFVGLGTVTASTEAVSGTGPFSDPFGLFNGSGTPAETPATATGTLVPDANEAANGRYTISMLVTPSGDTGSTLSVVIYQASANESLWIDNDSEDLFCGSLQMQGSLTGAHANWKGAPKAQAKRKH